MTAAVTPQIRWTAVGTVVTVAAVAAVMSYGHLMSVAAEQGEDIAVLFPLSVDGLIVAASLVLLVRRRSGQPGGALAWCGLLVGVAATVAGNIASAEPTALARVVAAWPPVAFALSYELLLSLIRPAASAEPEHGAEAAQEQPPPAADDGWRAPDPAPTAPVAPVEIPAPAPAPAPQPVPTAAAPAPAPVVAEPPEVDDDDLAARAARLLADTDGQPPGRRALAAQLGCTEHRARTLLDTLSPNGAHR